MKILKWIEQHLEEVIQAILLVYIAGCMMLQVFMRHVMHASLTWSEESIRFAFVWLVFMGFGLAVKEKRHISITFLKDQVGPKAQFAMTMLANTVFFIYSILMAYYGIEVVQTFISTGQTSAALGIPRYIMFLSAPLGFGITMLRLIQSTVSDIKEFRKGDAA